jgi:hypothetical protein
MPHDNHTSSDTILEVGEFATVASVRDYLLEMVRDWEDPYVSPQIVNHAGIDVVRDDMLGNGVGTKARAADYLVQTAPSDTLVYVQPRVGLAGLSLIDCAKRHGKRVVLFMPASQRISLHQACTIEAGAEPRFVRVAAMPNLNKIAERWAADNGAFFIPLGLRHRLATASLIKVAMGIKAPHYAVTAVSTGVLTRALQMAWPETFFFGVAVSRNLKEGEKGRASIYSDKLPFQTPEKPDLMPPFPTVATYDAKAWKYVVDLEDDFNPAKFTFWNVGKDPVLEDESVYDRTASNVDWIRS